MPRTFTVEILTQYMNYVHSKELPELLENEVVVGVAKKHGKTPAQVCLRYIVQRDIVVIPKSTNAERLTANIQVPVLKKMISYCLHRWRCIEIFGLWRGGAKVFFVNKS